MPGQRQSTAVDIELDDRDLTMPRRKTPTNSIEMAEIMTSRWQSFPNIGGLTRTLSLRTQACALRSGTRPIGLRAPPEVASARRIHRREGVVRSARRRVGPTHAAARGQWGA